MKILIITYKFPPQKCGIGNYTSFLCYNLIKNKNDVRLITTSPKKINNNVNNLTVSFRFLDFFKIINFVKEWNPEIIHFQYTPLLYKNNLFIIFLSYILFIKKKKILFSWHELFSKKTYIYYILFLIIKPTVIVVRKNFIKKLNFISKFLLPRLFYIPSSVTLNFKKIYFKKNLKKKYLPNNYKRLFIFYGFMFPHKNVEVIPKIINFSTDFVIISFDINKNNVYHNDVVNFFKKKEYKKNFKIKYLTDEKLADVLQIVDAIILPFKIETGSWNTSINNAVSSKSFTLTTSIKKRGYHKSENIFYANSNDFTEMRNALNKYSGIKNKNNLRNHKWDKIAKKHLKVYKKLCKG